MEIDRSGLEVLDRAECLRLLAAAPLGRIAVTSAALPMVFPVTFALVGDEIVFQTGRGTTLDAATRDAVVAFEVDAVAPDLRHGWSVVVTGVARELSRMAEAGIVPSSLPAVWGRQGDNRTVSVSTELISGRRIVGLGGPGDVGP